MVARNQLAFKRRGVKLMALSSNSLEDDGWNDWIKDVESCAETKVDFPIIADPERTVSYRLNMLDVDALDDRGRPLNARAIHVIRPDNKVGLLVGDVTSSLRRSVLTLTKFKTSTLRNAPGSKRKQKFMEKFDRVKQAKLAFGNTSPIL